MLQSPSLFHSYGRSISIADNWIKLSCILCATCFFLPHSEVTCDLLLNRCRVTWNLFVKSTIENYGLFTRKICFHLQRQLPSLILYFGMTEFQKWLNMVGRTCMKYRCFIVSRCVRFLSRFVKNKTKSMEQASFCLYNGWIKIVHSN